MDKRGQTMGIAIMSAIFIFIIGMMTINFMMDEITNARVNLDCASPADISDGTKLLCLAFDSTVPYWILLVFSISTGAVIGRVIR